MSPQTYSGFRGSGPFWRVTSNNGVKRIHRPTCGLAKSAHDYSWAEGRTAPELIDALVASSAIQWHTACARCCPNLKRAIDDAVSSLPEGES